MATFKQTQPAKLSAEGIGNVQLLIDGVSNIIVPIDRIVIYDLIIICYNLSEDTSLLVKQTITAKNSGGFVTFNIPTSTQVTGNANMISNYTDNSAPSGSNINIILNTTGLSPSNTIRYSATMTSKTIVVADAPV